MSVDMKFDVPAKGEVAKRRSGDQAQEMANRWRRDFPDSSRTLIFVSGDPDKKIGDIVRSLVGKSGINAAEKEFPNIGDLLMQKAKPGNLKLESFGYPSTYLIIGPDENSKAEDLLLAPEAVSQDSGEEWNHFRWDHETAHAMKTKEAPQGLDPVQFDENVCDSYAALRSLQGFGDRPFIENGPLMIRQIASFFFKRKHDTTDAIQATLDWAARHPIELKTMAPPLALRQAEEIATETTCTLEERKLLEPLSVSFAFDPLTLAATLAETQATLQAPSAHPLVERKKKVLSKASKNLANG